MPVLKCTSIDHIVYSIENLVPFPFMRFHRNRFGLCQSPARSLNRLFTVDPRRYERRQPSRNVFALFPHSTESIDCPFGLATDFPAYIPASETFVLPVILPNLINHIFIMFDLVSHIPGFPKLTGIVQTEPKFHTIFLGQPKKHIDQIDRRHITTFAQQILRRISNKFFISRTNKYDRIDSDGFHIPEVPIPFFLTPILMWNIVRYFVEKRPCDFQPIRFRDNKSTALRGSRKRRRHTITTQCFYLRTYYRRGSSKCDFFKKISPVIHDISKNILCFMQ